MEAALRVKRPGGGVGFAHLQRDCRAGRLLPFRDERAHQFCGYTLTAKSFRDDNVLDLPFARHDAGAEEAADMACALGHEETGVMHRGIL